MANVLHGSARTTPRIRAERQARRALARAAARQFGLKPKTILKWHRESITTDALMGPKTPKSTVLTSAEEAIIIKVRRGAPCCRSMTSWAVCGTPSQTSAAAPNFAQPWGATHMSLAIDRVSKFGYVEYH